MERSALKGQQKALVSIWRCEDPGRLTKENDIRAHEVADQATVMTLSFAGIIEAFCEWDETVTTCEMVCSRWEEWLNMTVVV